MSKLKKIVEELRESKSTELEAVDKGIANFSDVPGMSKFWYRQYYFTGLYR